MRYTNIRTSFTLWDCDWVRAARYPAKPLASMNLATAHDEAKFTFTVVMGIDGYRSIETKKSY